MRLYIVRHGVTAWNQEGRIQGHTDTPLSAEGMVQAQRIGARLARLEQPLQAVWSSDLMRARQTAEAVAAPFGLTVQMLAFALVCVAAWLTPAPVRAATQAS